MRKLLDLVLRLPSTTSNRNKKGFGTDNVQKLIEQRDVNGLIKALRYRPNSYVRQYAAIGLGNIADMRAVDPLIVALKDESWQVRETAASALGKIGDKRAAEPLIFLLDDVSGEVRLAAAKSVKQIDWQPGNSATGAIYWISKGDWAKCVEMGPIAVRPLINFLMNRRSDEEIEGAGQALAMIGTSDADLAPLTKRLTSETDTLKRRNAATALGWIGNKSAVPLLVKTLLEDEEWTVIVAAVHALGQIGDERAILPLTKTANYEDVRLRERARAAAMATSISSSILREAENAEYEVRKAAEAALDKIQSADNKS